MQNLEAPQKNELRGMLGIQPDIGHSPKDAFEFAAENGFNHIEIFMEHPFYSRENLSYSEVLELKGCYDIDLLIHAPVSSLNFLSTSEAMRRMSYSELEKIVYFSERCNADVVTFHLGWNQGFITGRGFIYQPEIYERHNREVILSELYPFLKEHNNRLCLENTVDIDNNLRDCIVFLLKNTEVGLTFDVGHYYIKKGHDLYLSYFDRVRNIHLHDNDGINDLHNALNDISNLNVIPKSYDGFYTIEVRDVEGILNSQKYFNKWIGK